MLPLGLADLRGLVALSHDLVNGSPGNGTAELLCAACAALSNLFDCSLLVFATEKNGPAAWYYV